MKYFFLLFSIFFLTSCFSQNNTAKNQDTIRVEASIVPLASIVNQIGGTEVNVSSLVPVGMSPHGFDLKPSQMQDIADSDLIVMVGLEHIDGFLDPIVTEKNVIRVSSGIMLLEAGEDDDEDHPSTKSEHAIDPHVWTSAENAIIIARSITDALSVIRPEKQDFFEKNFADFCAELTAHRDSFLASQSGRTIVPFLIFHDAYNYLFSELRIPLEKKNVFQKTTLSDPDIVDIKNLIDVIQKNSITVAFREPQLVSTNLESLAQEYGMTIFVLDPLGTDTSSGGFIANYQKNLESLAHIYH